MNERSDQITTTTKRRNAIIGPNFKVRIGFRMSTSIFGPILMSKQDFRWQNAIFILNSNDKIGFQMPKCNIQQNRNRTQLLFQKFSVHSQVANEPEFESQNRISYVNILYLARIGMSKQRRNAIFGPNSKVRIGFRMSKFDILPELECQNRLSNVRMRYSVPVKRSTYDFE